MTEVMFGGGLRLNELLRLRVQDVDLERGTVRVRGGKGDKDRVSVLAESVKPALRRHLERLREHVMQRPGLGVRSPLDG